MQGIINEIVEREINEEGEEVRWEGPYNEAKDDAEMFCGVCDCPIDSDDWYFCPVCGVRLLIHGRDIL